MHDVAVELLAFLNTCARARDLRATDLREVFTGPYFMYICMYTCGGRGDGSSCVCMFVSVLKVGVW